MGIRVHENSLKKLKTKLKEITGRSNAISMELRSIKLRQSIVGWVNYFKLADMVNEGKLYIDCEEPDMIERITQELEQVKQKDIDSDKKKGVIPKDKIKEVLGRSPDFSDTLSMRMYFELKPKFVIAAA